MLRHLAILACGLLAPAATAAATRHQTLTLRVVAAPCSDARGFDARGFDARGFDASHLWFRARGAAEIPFERFPPDGQLEVVGVQPGRYALQVVWPSGDRWEREVLLAEGARWLVELELERDAEIEVGVGPSEAVARLADAFVELTYTDRGGARCSRRNALGEDGVARFPECPAREVWIEVRAGAATVATGCARFAPDEPSVARVELCDKSLAVVLVDERGAPLGGGRVDVTPVAAAELWSLRRDTDERGRALFTGLAFDELFVSASHPTAGTRAGVLVPLAPVGRSELEMVVAGGADLRLRCVDAGRPLAGLAVALHQAARSIALAERITEAGIARFERMEPGAYFVRVDHPGLWPCWRELEFRGARATIELDLPSRGRLALRVRDATGRPVGGAQAGLRWLATGERAEDWAVRGWIEVRPHDFRTDASGALELCGIPRGRYELELATPAGTRMRERLDVPGCATRTRTLTLAIGAEEP